MPVQKIAMPGGGDESIDSNSVWVIRELTSSEREEAPTAQSCVFGGGFRIYPALPISALLDLFPGVRFAQLTAPGGMTLLVNAESIVDRDDRSSLRDAAGTNSVLCFGVGALAPRIRVRETLDDLIRIWARLGLPTSVLE